jgi:flagellar hook-basal body complex protein FliE
MFIQPLQYKPLETLRSGAPQAESTSSFRETLAQALGTVTQAMETADHADEALLTGRAESIHEAQIAAVKADVLMKLTTNLTSKLAHCTTQLFQMQV